MADPLKPGPAKKATLVGLVGAGAAAILVATVPKFEGTVLKGYIDPVGIPTKCMGDTHGVVVGKRYTSQECADSLDRQLYAHAAPVLACTPQLQGKTYQLAAAVSFAYNVGAGAYCKGSVGQNFRAGKDAAACAAMSKYVYAGGRVLPGLVKRRAAERAICEKGL